MPKIRFTNLFAERIGGVNSVDVPGATATRVFGINAHGDMVGSYVDGNGRTHGFLAQGVDNP